MAFDLGGRVALVTGAAKGIGRCCVEVLRQAGARVIATDVDDTAIKSLELGEGSRHVRHDVTSASDWTRIIASIEEIEGRLDVLVNNAGIILNRPFLMTSLEEFRRVQVVNVESVWIGMQTAAPLLQRTAQKTCGGSIINLSSIYGQLAGPMQAAYCASKGAVRLMTKAVAVELARSEDGKVRVNSVHPGPVETELGFSGLKDAVALGRLPNVEAGIAAVRSLSPMGRWGHVDDIAGAVLFLASDHSSFMTGSELTVDGGYTLL